MRNLEAKFRIDDAALARRRAEALGFSMRATLEQRDTFFRVTHGKLKLREEADSAALIRYGRVRRDALELSDYEIVAVVDPAALRALLGAALGVLAEVRKQRTLLLRRNLRLHLDQVEWLGSFGEIEAVMTAEEPPGRYRAEVTELLAALQIDSNKLISKSYFELMEGGTMSVSAPCR